LDIVFLAAYLLLPVLAFAWVRSLTWLAVGLSFGLAFGGAIISFTSQNGVVWDRRGLQFVLLGVLLAVAAAGFVARRLTWPGGNVSVRRQLLVVGIPMVMIVLAVIAVRRIADSDGLWSAVTYFINQPVAEDNAKWLDFSAQLASGGPIEQAVPMGGPLQLLVVLMSTVALVLSVASFGGVNEVFVAVWSALFSQFGLLILVPLALAPLAEARVLVGARKRGLRPALIPWPVIWLSMLIMVAASLLVTRNGHLTLQFVFLSVGLWVVIFLGGPSSSRTRIFVSLAAAVSATVWLPLNVIAIGILVCLAGCISWRLIRALKVSGGLKGFDWVSLVAVAFVAVTMWSPLLSGLIFGANIGTASAAGHFTPIGGGGVRAAVGAVLPRSDTFLEGLQLFTANGGTAATGPILALLAGGALLLAMATLTRGEHGVGITRTQRLAPFIPACSLVIYSSLLAVVDMWVTGSGPHYGALKMLFFVTIIVLSAALPFAIMGVDRRRAGLTMLRAAAVMVVCYLLVVDGLLPRAAAELRPAQWSAVTRVASPYWSPAEIKDGVADQTIARNPVGCVYLPPGAKVPTALPEGQRAYSCTRILSGLSGMDSTAQPLVDWLRTEWQGNTGSWAANYDWMAGMPKDVLSKNVILLDDDSRVVGFESVGGLLSRFPKSAGEIPAP
jgi:hypothetical protein